MFGGLDAEGRHSSGVCVPSAPAPARAWAVVVARHAVTMQVGTKEVTIGDGTTLEVRAFV